MKVLNFHNKEIKFIRIEDLRYTLFLNFFKGKVNRINSNNKYLISRHLY